jgi:hypothetical protein
VLARVPAQFHLGGLGEGGVRAVPLAVTRGVQTTGIYYNKALLDRAGLEPPKTIADLKAMVEPLAAIGVSPLVHPAGDPPFNPLLVMWLLPMIAERAGNPIAFVESTVKGEVRYDSPEWVETFRLIAELRESGVLLDGSGATDYATLQLLFLQGKAAMTYNGTWAPRSVAGGDAHSPVRPPRGAPSARRGDIEGSFDPCLGRLRASPPRPSRAVTASPLSSSSPVGRRWTRASSKASRPSLRSPLRMGRIHDAVQREFLPMLEDSITSLNWLWEPRSTPRSRTRSRPS